MSRPITSIPTRTIAGRSVPWLLATLNHNKKPTTWQKIPNAEEGPEGQYWSYDSSDNYDKSVWVIEGDEPVVPQNIFNPEVAEEIGVTAELDTTGLLNATMATRYGLRIPGWDVHSGSNMIILGETPLDFIVAAKMSNFDWAKFDDEWSPPSPQALKDELGKGRNNAVPIHGKDILSWRLVDVSQPLKSTPWINVRPERHGFDLSNEAMFVRNEELVDEMKLITGRRYWKLPKHLVKEAIRVTKKDFRYDTLNLNPQKMVEITWMAESIASQEQVINTVTRDRSAVTMTKYHKGKSVDIFKQSRLGRAVQYDNLDRCHIDFDGFLRHPDILGLIADGHGGPSVHGGMTKLNWIRITCEVGGKASTITLAGNARIDGKTLASLGIVHIDTSPSHAKTGGKLIVPCKFFRASEPSTDIRITAINADYNRFVYMAGH